MNKMQPRVQDSSQPQDFSQPQNQWHTSSSSRALHVIACS